MARLRTPSRLVLAVLLILTFVWPGFRTLLGLPPRAILFVYVREENSQGLGLLDPVALGFGSFGLPPTLGEDGDPLGAVDLPSAESGLRLAGDLEGQRDDGGAAGGQGVADGQGLADTISAVRLPPAAGRIPSDARVLVLRETFAAGVLVESRAVFLSRLPGLTVARPEGGLAGLNEHYALLSLDLRLAWPEGGRDAAGRLLIATPRVKDGVDAADGSGAGSPAGGVSPVAMAASDLLSGVVLGPGQEWRLGAVGREDGSLVVLETWAEGWVSLVKGTFAAGLPVSVLSVINFGRLDTDKIESGSDGEG